MHPRCSFTRNRTHWGALSRSAGAAAPSRAAHAEELPLCASAAPVNDYFDLPGFTTIRRSMIASSDCSVPAPSGCWANAWRGAETAALAAQGSPVVSEFVSPLMRRAPRRLPLRGAETPLIGRKHRHPSSATSTRARDARRDPAEVRAAVGSEKATEAALFRAPAGEGELRK